MDLRTFHPHRRRLLALFGLLLAGTAQAQMAPARCPPLLQHSVNRLQDDKPQPLCQCAGKELLVVDTASCCRFTSQCAAACGAAREVRRCGQA